MTLPFPTSAPANTSWPDPGGLRFAPATRVMWRSADQVQVEVGARGVIVEGLPDATLDQLFGQPTTGEPLDGRVGNLLNALHRAGFLAGDVDTGGPTGSRTRDQVGSMLLAPDLAALSEQYGEAAPAILAARTDRRVLVRGSGRLPTQIGVLLAAAGIGGVNVAVAGDVVLRDAAPGGLLPDDEGKRQGAAAAEAVRRAAPGVDSGSVAEHEADLIVLTTSAPLRAIGPGAERPAPHLISSVWGGRAVIGPLVVPGVTSCLRCADLHRCDRDPTWPALAAQLNVRRAERDPNDVLVCTFAAAATAMQAVAFLDGERPSVLEGTLELALPDWRLRRRSWPPHPDCGCLAPT